MLKVKTLTGTKRKSRGRENIKMLSEQVLFFFLALILSRIKSFGESPGFALGLVAGADSLYVISSALGAAAGYFTGDSIFSSLRSVTSCAFAAFIRTGFDSKINPDRKMLFSALLSFISYSLSTLAVFFAAKRSYIYLFEGICEALVSAAFSCFVLRVFSLIKSGRQGVFFTPSDTVSFMFVSAVFLRGFSEISLWGYTPGNSLSYFFIMLFSLISPSLSSAAGAALSVMLTLSSGEYYMIFSFVLSGLLSGMCIEWGRAAAAVSVFLSALLSLIVGGGDSLIMSLAEVFVPCMLFILLPEKLLKKPLGIFPAGENGLMKEERDIMSFRLERTAKTLKDVSASVVSVSEFLIKSDRTDINSVCNFVKEDVCRECIKKDFCWKGAEKITEQAFRETLKETEKNGFLRKDALSGRLRLICTRAESLTEAFNRYYFEYRASEKFRKEMSEARISSASLMNTATALLYETAEKTRDRVFPDRELSSAALKVLSEFIPEVKSIAAVREENGMRRFEAFCGKIPPGTDRAAVSDRLYDITGRVFMPFAADEYSENGSVLSFCEETALKVHFSKKISCATGEHWSGDTAECFFDGRGKFYAVLSDGMGTGERAAVDSVMTGTLMSRLIKSGFSPEVSLPAVNSALMMKGGEETLSTLDVLEITLSTGKTRFFKAGGSDSVIYKEGRTAVIEKSSVPLGILEEAEFSTSETFLSEGDIAVIMSDGASYVSPKFFRQVFSEEENPEKISEKILENALASSVSGRHDDITVITVALRSDEAVQT